MSLRIPYSFGGSCSASLFLDGVLSVLRRGGILNKKGVIRNERRIYMESEIDKSEQGTIIRKKSEIDKSERVTVIWGKNDIYGIWNR